MIFSKIKLKEDNLLRGAYSSSSHSQKIKNSYRSFTITANTSHLRMKEQHGRITSIMPAQSDIRQ